MVIYQTKENSQKIELIGITQNSRGRGCALALSTFWSPSIIRLSGKLQNLNYTTQISTGGSEIQTFPVSAFPMLMIFTRMARLEPFFSMSANETMFLYINCK